MSKSYKLWHLCLIGAVLANVAYLAKDLIGWVVTLCFFLIVPGLLFLKGLKVSFNSKWETISLSLGLSVLLLILSGLVLNATSIFGVNRPLTTLNIFITLDLLVIVLLTFNRKQLLRIAQPKIAMTLPEWLTGIVLTLLPLLAICGAMRLNNGASNVLTLALFALIALIFLILVRFRNLQSLYPYAIVMMGLSILFTVSLRGWLITGHDIQREFYVFQLTSNSGHWDIKAFRNPYNACLSITILPTILAKITTISAPYIFKAVFQIIFALGLAPAYMFMKRMSNARIALISSFVFISFPTFLNDMPFLGRQEIAFVFFALLMLTAFMQMAKRQKTILTLCWLIGLILSHYSSSYVALAILILAALFYKLLCKRIKDEQERTSYISLLSVVTIIAALLITFLWNFQITTTTAGLKRTLTESVTGLIDHSSTQSGDVGYSLFAPSPKTPPELLNNYAGKSADLVQYLPPADLPISGIGKKVSHIINVESLNNVARTFSAKILQVLLLVGVGVLFFRHRKNSGKREVYFLALTLSCVVLLVLQTLLPQLSVDYGTLRFFQQALIILAIPIVLGGEAVFKVLSRTKATFIVAVFFALLFLDLSGFIPQVLGGYPAQLSLNNSGSYYDVYYVHKGELISSAWLSAQNPSNRPITMDQYAQIRFLPAISQGKVQTVNPLSGINSSFYFYQDSTNIVLGRYAAEINDNALEYTYTQPINAQNTIYSNQDSRISK